MGRGEGIGDDMKPDLLNRSIYSDQALADMAAIA